MNPLTKLHSLSLRTRLLIIVSLLIILAFWQANTRPPILHPPYEATESSLPCIAVRPELGPYQEATIDTSGLHCIAVDFWQQRLSDFAGHTGPAPYRQLLSVMANDVTLDMANHTLHSDGHSSGIVAVRVQEGERAVPKNITIKNGVLDLRGLGTGIKVLDHWPMYDIDTPPPNDFPGFKKSGVVLENLLIKTDNVGVMLEGDGNIIRNCVIESGGDSAIMMAGPNGRILNNKIILSESLHLNNHSDNLLSQFNNLSTFLKTERAAIVLHQATGTIISGNHIFVKKNSPMRHNIYLTDTSIGVRIIGNTITTTGKIVTLKKGSTAELK